MALDSVDLDAMPRSAIAAPCPAPAPVPSLSLTEVHHRYGKSQAPVLTGIDLDVAAGEVVALLGPSGCGKTTLLRIIAGLIAPSHGRVVMAGNDVTEVAPHKRNVGLVHQNFALWPHMTVAENVAFGLDMRRSDRPTRMARVQEVLDLVGLDGYGHRLPRQLSGGQQQRVALARALAFEPTVLLLDEPLSSLDANLRHQLQSYLRQLQRTTGVTTVIVTHDREEAMGVSSRIVVLDGGCVAQVATAPDLYRSPATAFVMRFTGECNLLDAVVDVRGGAAVAGLGRVAVDDRRFPTGAGVRVGFRPEHVRLGLADADAPVARIRDAAFLGPVATYELELEQAGSTPPVVIVARHETSAGSAMWRPGEQVRIDIPPTAFRVFPQEEAPHDAPVPDVLDRHGRPARARPWRRRHRRGEHT